MQILSVSFKGLFYEKKKSLTSVILVALSCMVALLSISVVMSFIVKTFGELEDFSPVLSLYTGNSSGAQYTLLKTVNIVSVVLSSAIILVLFIISTLGRKKEFKNYSLLGASFSQIALIAWVKNILLLLAGVIIGAVLSFGVSALIGAISSTAMIFSLDTVWIAFLIYFALVSIISIVIPLWS